MKGINKKRNKIIKTVIASVAVFVILLLLMFNSGIGFLRQISGYIIIPVQNGLSAAFKGIGDFFTGFADNVQMKQEQQELIAEAEQKQLYEQQLKDALLENERLRELLGEKSKYPDMKFVYADVILKNVDSYSSTYTLNKGTKDGIEKDMVVVAIGGLAGRIIEVSDTYCVMLSIIDSRSSVPGIVESSRDTGIVKGIAQTGQVQSVCEMSNMPMEVKTVPGDKVVTSGMGGVFPKGIVIGEVMEVTAGDTQLDTTAQIVPAVDFDHLEHVLIIQEARTLDSTQEE